MTYLEGVERVRKTAEELLRNGCKCPHPAALQVTLTVHDQELFGIKTHRVERLGCGACGCSLGYDRTPYTTGAAAGFAALIMVWALI